MIRPVAVIHTANQRIKEIQERPVLLSVLSGFQSKKGLSFSAHMESKKGLSFSAQFGFPAAGLGQGLSTVASGGRSAAVTYAGNDSRRWTGIAFKNRIQERPVL